MANCPLCNSEIDELKCSELREGTCSVDEQPDGTFALEYDDDQREPEINYICPVCKKVVATSEKKAIEILKEE